LSCARAWATPAAPVGLLPWSRVCAGSIAPNSAR